MTWLLMMFIANGWGGGEVKVIASFPTEQSCTEAGKKLYSNMQRAYSPVCIQGEEPKNK